MTTAERLVDKAKEDFVTAIEIYFSFLSMKLIYQKRIFFNLREMLRAALALLRLRSGLEYML